MSGTFDIASDQTSAVTFALKEVEDYTSFSINSITGEVTLTEDPDYESKSSYSFAVVAEDPSGNTSEQAVSLTINDVDEAISLWHSDAAVLADNWRYNDVLGYFNISTDPWIYHLQHGWLYVFPSVTDTDSVYFWDNTMQSVLWTSQAVYPSMYRFSDSTWIWYMKDSSNPRWFNELGTTNWEEQ
tara:strand:- start:101 stop:655 length:555 start_codon:yes stop_codon:yes gene_type:complete